jgi:hypothetical protein
LDSIKDQIPLLQSNEEEFVEGKDIYFEDFEVKETTIKNLLEEKDEVRKEFCEFFDIKEMKEKTCAICLRCECIEFDGFGMLMKCNHVFGLSCIQGWRKYDNECSNNFKKQCPICDKPSLFVIPVSNLFIY